ncbi:hypothetical protein H0H92_001378 [Tricholoma furcatifolium]|nr:hypothetical protein H0H92_001378 [Tricholoma furcatifolium]
MDTAFRKIDIDQYDEDVLHESELYDADPRDPAQVLEEAKERQALVRTSLARNDIAGALSTILENAPYGPNVDQAKDITLQTLLTILNTTKSTEISSVIKSLSQDAQDTLMKYLYKGMAMPGWGDISGSVLLGWHEKTLYNILSYATFKALSSRPLSETNLRRWSAYWIVVGIFVAFERLAESFVTWLPFYWEIKIAFLSFLALPQFQGSTYIYNAYVEPLFVNYESDLDAGVFPVLCKIMVSLQPHLIALRQYMQDCFNKAPSGWSIASYKPTFSLPSIPATTWTTYNPFATGIETPSSSAPNKPSEG